jgi:hypothetical protein
MKLLIIIFFVLVCVQICSFVYIFVLCNIYLTLLLISYILLCVEEGQSSNEITDDSPSQLAV